MNCYPFSNSALPFALALLLTACDHGAEAPQPVSATAAPGEATSMTTAINTQQQDQRLLAFFDEIFERDVSQSPEFQAQLGRKTEDYGSWDDHSDAWIASRVPTFLQSLHKVETRADAEA